MVHSRSIYFKRKSVQEFNISLFQNSDGITKIGIFWLFFCWPEKYFDLEFMVSGDSGEIGESSDSGESGETGEMGEFGQSCKIGESADLDETGQTCETGESNESGEWGESWETGTNKSGERG